MTYWTKILNGVKKFVKPSGYYLLQGVLDSLESYDKALINGDYPALISLYHNSAIGSIELFSHITNKKFLNTMYDVANGCISIAKKLENGGNVHDVAHAEKIMISALFAVMQ